MMTSKRMSVAWNQLVSEYRINIDLTFNRSVSEDLDRFHRAEGDIVMRSRQLIPVITMLCIGTAITAPAAEGRAGLPAQPPTIAPVGTDASAPPPVTAVASEALLIQEPGDVEFSIQITPTERSWALQVSAESGDYYRSTTIPLEGADSHAMHTFVWRGFPAGDYDIVGVLVDESGQAEAIVAAGMRVLGR